MITTRFRAWDKQDKKFIIHEQDFIPLKVTNIGVLKLDPTSQEERWILADFSRFVLEQNIGLKDKKSKEIHAGDVVEIMTYSYLEPIELIVGVVSYLDDRATFVFVEQYTSRHRSIDDIASDKDVYNYDIKIIGNIHENPELLK